MRFDAFPGNIAAKSVMKDMVLSGRMPHALLVEGPEGTGKFAAIRSLAQLLHCENPTSEGEPCGNCMSCRQHATLNHIDTFHVFPVVKTEKFANQAPVSDDFMEEWREFLKRRPLMDIKEWADGFDKKNPVPVIYVTESNELIRKLSTTAHASHFKIVLLWLAERLNEDAANKLLKLIEEPFSDTIFLLTSNDSSKILPTIYSRCRRIEFRRIGEKDIENYLSQYNSTISLENVRAIAKSAEGSLRNAVRLAETYEESSEFLEWFMELMRKAYSRDISSLRKWAEKTSAVGREQVLAFLSYMQRLIRENFVANSQLYDLLTMNPAEQQFSSRFSRFITERNVEALMKEIDEANIDIAGNGNGKIILFNLAVNVIMLLHR